MIFAEVWRGGGGGGGAVDFEACTTPPVQIWVRSPCWVEHGGMSVTRAVGIRLEQWQPTLELT